MEKHTPSHTFLNRREFIRKSVKAGGLLSIPTFIPASVLGRGGAVAPSERVNIAFIGLGKLASGSLKSSFAGLPDVQVVACCDIEPERVRNFQKSFSDMGVELDAYHDYQELLSRSDIDGVVIATPDHWHAKMTIDACRAGKDVYCEKPLSHTIAEAYAIVDAVNRYGRVLQTGSMQRSSREFRFAAEMVRSGRIGKVHSVYCSVGGAPKYTYDLVEQDPGAIDWDRWLGPAPYVPYNERIAPRNIDADWAKWRNYAAFGGGGQSDWGAHMYNIAQWGLGRDGDAPVEIIPPASGNPDRRHLTYVYADGVKMMRRKLPNFAHFGAGVEFHGEDGVIAVSRGKVDTKPKAIMVDPTRADEVALYRSSLHSRDFVNCMKSRSKPICSEIVGASTSVICYLGNIAERLKRSIDFDYKTGLSSDADANRLLDNTKRAKYAI